MKQVLHMVVLLLIACVAAVSGIAQSVEETPTPEVQDLGNQQYRIGQIEIDKAAGVFRVPGKILRDEPPLEFLVATKGGAKAYETLLEVNADAFQFNLACILIGFDAGEATPHNARDVNQPALGDPVTVSVSWTEGDKVITVDGADLLVAGEPAEKIRSRDWVYTGSEMLSGGRFLADLSGSLVGFAHVGQVIIEHEQGIGVGSYGSVNVNPAFKLPVGTPVELIISRPGPAKGAAGKH